MARKVFNETLNSLKLIGVIHRAEERIRLIWRPNDCRRLHFGNQNRQKFIMDACLNQNSRGCSAVLPSIEITGLHNLPSCRDEICIGKHNHRSLAT